jgi:hypothetical protein
MYNKFGIFFLSMFLSLICSDEYHNYRQKKNQVDELSSFVKKHRLPIFDDGCGSVSKDYKSLSEKFMDVLELGVDFTDKHAQNVSTYIHMLATIVKNGCKIFTKDARLYNLQEDVFDISYKKSIYDWIILVDNLLLDLALSNDCVTTCQASLLLCKIPVHEWYKKSFYKGLDRLYEVCFDEYGHPCKQQKAIDISVLFKEYYKKVPRSWVDIAAISDFWCHENALLFEKNIYHDKVTNSFSQFAIKIMSAQDFYDLLGCKQEIQKYPKFLLVDLYQEMFIRLLAESINEYGVCCLIEQDPIFKKMSYQEKCGLSHNQTLHEILIMRSIVFTQMYNYFIEVFQSDLQSDKYNSLLHNALYKLLPDNHTIFYVMNDDQVLKAMFFELMTYFDQNATDFLIFKIKK